MAEGSLCRIDACGSDDVLSPGCQRLHRECSKEGGVHENIMRVCVRVCMCGKKGAGALTIRIRNSHALTATM